MRNKFIILFIPFTLFFFREAANAQSEVAPWGNIMGIRTHGQLFEFETSLKVLSNNGSHSSTTAKERQRPYYSRDHNKQIVSTNIDSLYFKETVTDKGQGEISVAIQINPRRDTLTSGVFFCITLPGSNYADGKLQLIKADNNSPIIIPATRNAKGIRLIANDRNLDIILDESMQVIVKKDTLHGNNNLLLHFLLAKGALHKGDSLQKHFTIKVSGQINKAPVNIQVNTAQQGNPFDGFGGNFRLQNSKHDPQVIDYSLNNLHVAWGRVEMPWSFWQPQINIDPTDSAKQNVDVVKAMKMAEKLNKMGIPVILSAWAPPAWAIVGKPTFKPVNGIWGNPLKKENLPDIYKSIADYIIYLKVHYGVEIKLFSFNESDIGINIRVTANEHDALIKGLGAYFVSHGLKTKMLLGDNSDATTYKFIYPALNDPAALPYIGAISFHSWRGWDKTTLEKWTSAAKQVNLPLIVGEGSIDAQAWGYPQIFQEPSYALQEINLYTRLLNICQPLSILQWQLTSDYSPLIGGGIFGNNEPLHPGQRFWNFKQLASTPPHLFSMSVTCNVTDVSCAALGDNVKGIYTIHLVNNQSTRKATITGLPVDVVVLHVYMTNKKSYMKEIHSVKVKHGALTFKMNSTSYYTIICRK